MTSLLNVIKIYQLVQKLIGGQIHRRMVISLAYIFPLGRKVG
jgi:ribosomal protein S3AE